MKRALCLAVGILAFGASNALSQAPTCTDLGIIGDISSDYNVPDYSFNDDPFMSEVHWYCFTIMEGTSAAGRYFDIDLFATGPTGQADTEIGVFDSAGNRIADDDDDGHSLRSALTFGNTTPRTMPADPFGFSNGLAANGRDGNIGPGTYYLSVSLFPTTFGANNWSVSSTASANPPAVTVNFRTDIIIPEPASGLILGILGVAGLVGTRRRR